MHNGENLFPHRCRCFICFFASVRLQNRCEQILRSNPESRLAAELHLASIESKEQQDAKAVQDAAIGGAVAAVAAGVAIGVVRMLLTKR